MDKELFVERADSLLRSNILPFWIENMVDPQGGFYGRISGEGVLFADAPKGAVLNARILWTFAAAYRLYRDEKYLEMATRAKDYLLTNFYDHTYGGVYWSLTADGRPLDTKKQFYALGFAIYGLSEYYRATNDQTAIEYAIKLFDSIEQHSYNTRCGGYTEAATRRWDEIEDMRLSEKDVNEKMSMNTHLHILEPYTNLYRVWKSPILQERIVNLVNIFLSKIYD